MPFAYHFRMHHIEMNNFLENEGKLYIDEFKPKKLLMLWIKDSEDYTSLVTDIDLFPVDRTNPLLQNWFTPIDQNHFNNICNTVLKYQFQGDIDLCGDRDFNGSPPILGNPN